MIEFLLASMLVMKEPDIVQVEEGSYVHLWIATRDEGYGVETVKIHTHKNMLVLTDDAGLIVHVFEISKNRVTDHYEVHGLVQPKRMDLWSPYALSTLRKL